MIFKPHSPTVLTKPPAAAKSPFPRGRALRVPLVASPAAGTALKQKDGKAAKGQVLGCAVQAQLAAPTLSCTGCSLSQLKGYSGFSKAQERICQALDPEVPPTAVQKG